MPEITLTIPLSGSVSSPVDLSQRRLVAITVPVLNAATLMLGGAFAVNSGENSFSRLLQPTLSSPASGDLVIQTGTGSKMIVWPDSIPTPSYVRLELSAAQSAAREFVIRVR